MSPAVRVEQFEDVQEQWEEILPSCSTNTIFITPWWQGTWWRHFGAGSELRVLTLHDNGTALGIAPLMLRDGVLRFLGGSDLFDYHDFLVPKGREAAFYHAFFDYLKSVDWHTVDLTSLPQDSPALRYLPSLAEKNGFAVEVLKEDMAPGMTLPSTWDEYLAGLSKKGRHELRRKWRRLEETGVSRQSVYKSPQTLPKNMQDFFRLHRASRPDKAEFMTPEREEFFADVAVELGARDQFRLTFLELDGVRVASCINLDYGESSLLYNSGYDPNYSQLSVGFLSNAMGVKDAIEAGKRYFDFLRGAERYKYDLGAKDQAVYQVVLRH